MAGRKKKDAQPKDSPFVGLPLNRPASHEEIIDLARQHGAASIRALADVMSSGSDSSRVAAAKELLDRGYGKAGQSLEVSGPDGGAIPVAVGITPAVADILSALKGKA